MKLNLFTSAAFLFTILHLCKAGPLRLHKRAAFYIANETACVVDNIVYSNGDPIPTDDPCEACKCRPPGFACVLKDCKVKPGCKAVRRVGQCCPDYVCGCEHNGRMYRDGEEIRDPKNPCYQCHCQGSSIACAFVDCFFRDDCETLYLPGECCPQNKNCTRDFPDGNQLPTGNALPPVNLLPALNDESVLLANFPIASQPEEKPADDPFQTSTSHSSEETLQPENKEPTKASNELQTTPSVNIETEDVKLDPEVADEKLETTNEDRKDASDDEKPVEISEEIEVLFHSETETKNEDHGNIQTVKVDPTQSSVEEIKEDKIKTTISNEPVQTESVKNADEAISTEIAESEKEIRNSAADNGKSLNLSDEELTDPQKDKEIEVDEAEKTQDIPDKTITESQTELHGEIQTEIPKENFTESKPESKEDIHEETQTKSQYTTLSKNDKIKSESAETVTIVVHVREKTNPPPTERVTEKIILETETTTAQENLVKSMDELKSTEVSEEPTKGEAVPTDKIFSSSTEINKDESTTNLPLTTEPEGKIEERSDETDSVVLDAEESHTSGEKSSDLESNKESLVATTTQNINEVTEVSKDATTNEKVEDTKVDEPAAIVMKIGPNESLKITTDFTVAPNTEEQTTKESEKTKSEEIVESHSETINEAKSEEIVESHSDTINEGKPEEVLETHSEIINESKSVEKVEDGKIEAREDASTPTEETSVEKIESTSPAKFDEATIEKIEETTEKVQESTPQVKLEETVSEEKLKEPTPEEKLEGTTVENIKVYRLSDNLQVTPEEKSKEYTSTENSKELTPEAEKTQEMKSEESTEKTNTTAEERVQETESGEIDKKTSTETTELVQDKSEAVTKLENTGTEK